MAQLFQIATLSNDPSLYAAMRKSMEAAGFDETHCRFTLFDNSLENVHEPYGVLARLPSMGEEPYVILCHHDLLFGPQTTLTILRQRIDELERSRPNWAVAGCAGMTVRAEGIMNIDDPAGSHRASHLPREVLTLDELFLVFRRDRFPKPSAGLSGFHFYGTDLAINARLEGNRALVIDFPVHHLSQGNLTGDAFVRGRAAMADILRTKAVIGLVATTCTDIRVSCSPTIERLLGSTVISVILRRIFLGFVSKPRWWR